MVAVYILGKGWPHNGSKGEEHMIVRKVRGQDKVGKITLTANEVALAKKMGVPLEKYAQETLLFIAKKRKWKWFFNKEKNT